MGLCFHASEDEWFGKTALYTLLMGISSRTKHERLAWEFLKELCYDLETQSQIPESDSGLPVIREAVEQIQAEDINMEVVRDAMECAQTMPHLSGIRMQWRSQTRGFRRWSMMEWL